MVCVVSLVFSVVCVCLVMCFSMLVILWLILYVGLGVLGGSVISIGDFIV